MRLPPSEWEHLAPSSAGSIRVNHRSDRCSGESDSMIVERRKDGSLSSHCFRCGGRGFIRGVAYYATPTKPTESTADGGGVVTAGAFVPADCHSEWSAFPAECRRWLTEAGIEEEIVTAKEFLWSDSKQCLYIPVWQESKTTVGHKHVGYVQRFFNPKGYLTRTNDKDNFYGHYIKGASSSTIVVVEDVLSAIRCAEVCDSIALLGVAVKPPALTKLLTCGYKRAIIFLDGDNPQVKMAARAIAKRLFFLPTTIIETGRDPKSYSLEELQELLK